MRLARKRSALADICNLCMLASRKVVCSVLKRLARTKSPWLYLFYVILYNPCWAMSSNRPPWGKMSQVVPHRQGV
jgi:hypothetical protein